MSCFYPDIIRAYPRVRVGLFMSTTDTNQAGFDYSHVPNQPDGWVTELEQCAQSSAVMGSTAVGSNPYSTRMRPLSDMGDIYAAQAGVLLEAIEFIGYDGTRVGSPVQNADNNAAIEASQTSVLDAYHASHFINGVVGNWQPNYCRPSVFINDIDVLANMLDTEVMDPVSGARNHAGDMGIGVPLPFVVPYYLPFDTVTSVRVYGGLAQWIGASAEPTDKLVRYPLLCVMRWRMA